MNALADIRSLGERLWRRMTRREQLAVALMLGAAALFLIYMLLARPIYAYQQTTARELANDGDRMARIEALLGQLEAGVPRQADTRKPPRVRVTEAAGAAGIAIDQIEPLNPGFRVAVGNVPASALFGWLTDLENNKGVPVTAISVTKSAGGATLDASIRFGGRR